MSRIVWVAMEIEGIEEPAILDADCAHLARYRWRWSKLHRVYRYGDRIERLTHAVVGRPPKGSNVVHLDGNGMDFRRSNLATLDREAWIAFLREQGLKRTMHLRKGAAGPSGPAHIAAPKTARYR